MADALKEVQDNYNKIGFSSSTVFANAFKNVNTQIPEDYMEAGAFFDDVTMALLDNQVSYGNLDFSNPGTVPDLQMKNQMDFEENINEIMDEYADKLDEITAVAAEIEKLPGPDYENKKNDPTDSDDSKETNTDLDVSENLTDWLGDTKTIGGITVIETKEGYEVTNSRGQRVNYPKISVASVTFEDTPDGPVCVIHMKGSTDPNIQI